MSEKRKFYNVGDAKGFTKKTMFETIVAICNGENVDDNLVSLTAQAAQYELEGIENRPKKAGSGEKKDPLASDYAVAIAEKVIPLLKADAYQTCTQLADAAKAKGILSPTGKPFVPQWIARVLTGYANLNKGVKLANVKVQTTSKDGLKIEKLVTGYARA